MNNTPWGRADAIEQVADGITFYSTPSHGGYYLSPERNEQVPQRYRDFAAKWSKGYFDGSAKAYGWYEEDCAALAVVVTFPDLFPMVTEDDLTRYTEMLEGWVND